MRKRQGKATNNVSAARPRSCRECAGCPEVVAGCWDSEVAADWEGAARSIELITAEKSVKIRGLRKPLELRTTEARRKCACVQDREPWHGLGNTKTAAQAGRFHYRRQADFGRRQRGVKRVNRA